MNNIVTSQCKIRATSGDLKLDISKAKVTIVGTHGLADITVLLKMSTSSLASS
jgi:hypothetical protein